ncbi:hypothetical protein BDV29DRAFT_20618 [Aspergillus leporis]|jgi:uncharacterized protein (TIGR02118 family)|uniref:EthD domain-containing protein n=1 Tax=Aspergillus leporis TaxID=41062 RepID=A0A5N5XBF7_9EURO|nr:hypothetical protein BDV29DRAFT_20618 [Aspergillus leporis]
MTHTITVLFPSDADADYNIGYYMFHHMTLIERHWKKYGLQRWSVTKFNLALDRSQPPYAFGSTVVWENETSLEEATGSAESAEIMRDVAKFSNKQPVFLFRLQLAA